MEIMEDRGRKCGKSATPHEQFVIADGVSSSES